VSVPVFFFDKALKNNKKVRIIEVLACRRYELAMPRLLLSDEYHSKLYPILLQNGIDHKRNLRMSVEGMLLPPDSTSSKEMIKAFSPSLVPSYGCLCEMAADPSNTRVSHPGGGTKSTGTVIAKTVEECHGNTRPG